MKRLSTILFLLLLTLRLISQTAGFNYVPLEFENLEPIWLHDIHDSTIIGHEVEANPSIRFDGFSHVSRSEPTNPRFLVTDDAVILVSRIQYNNGIGGAIIEKLDLATGELKWKTLYDLRTQDRREYVMNIRVEGDRLLLYCIYLNDDRPDGAGTLFGYARGHLSIKEYDMSSGVLLHQTIPDTTSTDLVSLRTPFFDTELNVLSNDTITFIDQGAALESGAFFLLDTMSHEGIKSSPTDTLSHELSLDWGDTYLLRAHSFKIDPFTDDIYSVDYFKPNSQGPEARISQLIRYGNKHGREVIPFEYNDYENLINFHLREITETHIIIVAIKEDNLTDILFVDKMTGVIDRTINRGPREAIFSTYDILLEDGEVIAINYSNVGGHYSIDVYKSEGTEMSLLKRFKLDFPDYIPEGRALFKLEDGDYLLEFRYYGLNPSGNTPLGSFSGLMRITSDQLGLTTSTIEVERTPMPSIVVYPNPAIDNMTVRSDIEETYEIVIYDIVGRKVFSDRVDNYTKKVDISNLLSGHYYVHMITKDEAYVTKLTVE